jgi:hypothetical protein
MGFSQNLGWKSQPLNPLLTLCYPQQPSRLLSAQIQVCSSLIARWRLYSFAFCNFGCSKRGEFLFPVRNAEHIIGSKNNTPLCHLENLAMGKVSSCSLTIAYFLWHFRKVTARNTRPSVFAKRNCQPCYHFFQQAVQCWEAKQGSGSGWNFGAGYLDRT